MEDWNKHLDHRWLSADTEAPQITGKSGIAVLCLQEVVYTSERRVGLERTSVCEDKQQEYESLYLEADINFHMLLRGSL